MLMCRILHGDLSCSTLALADPVLRLSVKVSEEAFTREGKAEFNAFFDFGCISTSILKII